MSFSKSFCSIAVMLFALLAVGMPFRSSGTACAEVSPLPKTEAQPPKLAPRLIGTWTLEKASTPGSPSGVGSRLKMFTGTHWCIIQPDPATGIIVFQHGGRYELEGTKLKLTRDFAGESTRTMIGSTGVFELQVDGDTMTQTDADGTFNETWKRVK